MDRNKRPACVGLVGCAERTEAARSVGLLLDEAAEAGTVYERRSCAERRVEFVRARARCRGSEGCGTEGAGLAGCDTAILGLDATDARFDDALDSLAAGTAVYAVCVCMERRAEEALAYLHALEQACDQRSIDWGGGIAIENAQAVVAFEHSTRLGFWRRPVSEGIDRLLLAVRCGADAGLTVVRPGTLRRALAGLLLRLRGRRS